MWYKSSYSYGGGQCIQVWRKSTRSMSNGNCLEITDGIRVRDSKNPDVELKFTPDAWTDFVNGVRTWMLK